MLADRGRRTILAGTVLAVAALLSAPTIAGPLTAPRPLAAPVLEREGAVLESSLSGWDSYEVGSPTVLFADGLYRMWYHGSDRSFWMIGHAISSDGRTWTKMGIVLGGDVSDGGVVAYPEVLRIGLGYWMWYSAVNPSPYRIFLATSPDGMNWTKMGLALDVGAAGSDDDEGVADPSVEYRDGTYTMWYTGISSGGGGPVVARATSADGRSWQKQGTVLAAGAPGGQDASGAGFATVRLDAGRYEMFYTGLNASSSRILYAESSDGIAWSRHGVVLDTLPPDESPTLANPHQLEVPDGSLLVYYAARGSALDVYRASAPPESPISPTPPFEIPLWLLLLLVLVVPVVAIPVGVFLYLLRNRRSSPPPVP